jgi:phosphoenolpyruvate carboxykinase (GTP)
MPRPSDIDLEGLDINPEQFAAVQVVDVEAIKREIVTHEELFLKLAGEFPKELIFQRELGVARL